MLFIHDVVRFLYALTLLVLLYNLCYPYDFAIDYFLYQFGVYQDTENKYPMQYVNDF